MNNNINLPGFEEFIITDTKVIEGTYQIHLQVERRPHSCPACHHLTDKIHDYRIQKIQHMKVFSRATVIFYRKRRYVCRCGKRFYEAHPFVERYQRQSVELKQTLALELIHGKNFKDVAARFNTSPTTVMRQFDQISDSYLRETIELPAVIAIDEYKGDTDGETYQTIIADPIQRRPLEILKDRKKDTVKAYLKEYGRDRKSTRLNSSHVAISYAVFCLKKNKKSDRETR